MTAESDLEQTIRESAGTPKRARGDSGEVEAHPLQDQIAADRYLSAKEMVRRGIRALFKKIVPPGASS